MTRYKEEIFYITTFIVVAFLIYMNTLDHYFLSDDFNGVYRLGNLSFATIFRGFFTLNTQLYRPFINLFNKLNFMSFGDSPVAWNLINLLLNLLNTIVLFYFLRYFTDKMSSFLISLIFLTSFAHTQAVVWMSGRTSLLITMVFLGASVYFVKFSETKKVYFYLISIIIFFIGIFIKENIFIFPLLILMYLLYKKEDYKYSLPYFLIILIFLTIRIPYIFRLQTSVIAVKFGENLIKNTIYIFSAPLIPLNYPRIANQSVSMGIVEMIKQYPLILSLFFLPLLYIIAFFRNKKMVLWLFTATLILAIPVIVLPGSGERYLYLPSIGVLSILFATLDSFGSSIFKYGIIILFIGFSAIIAVEKNTVWNEASYISKDIVQQTEVISKRIQNNSLVCVRGLPDSYRGAYILRNGIDVIFRYIDHKNIKYTKKIHKNTIIIDYANGRLRELH